MVALFFYAKKGGFSMKNQSYLSVYKCNEFRVVSNEFIGRIEDTPENISAFVVSADFNSNYALVDDMDTVKVFTIGNFLDLVPDTEYLEKELRPVLLQMQFGEIEIPEVRYEREYDWRTGERLENTKIDNVQIVQLEVYKTGELKGYADFSVEIGDGKVEGLYRIYDPENGKEQTIVSFDNGYSSKEIIDTYSNTIETELKLATEDTYHSMIKADKNFDEIEQDDFDHDDIEI